MINEQQLDILKELINIGVGKAAGILNQYCNARVQLQVPEIQVLEDQETKYQNFLQNHKRLAAVQLPFQGSFSGKAGLIFPPDSATVLAKLVTGDLGEDMDLDEARIGALTEIGNVVLNGVMGSVGNVLKTSLRYGIPVYRDTSAAEMFSASGTERNKLVLVLAKARFQICESQVKGDIVTLFELGTFDAFLHELSSLVPAN